MPKLWCKKKHALYYFLKNNCLPQETTIWTETEYHGLIQPFPTTSTSSSTKKQWILDIEAFAPFLFYFQQFIWGVLFPGCAQSVPVWHLVCPLNNN